MQTPFALLVGLALILACAIRSQQNNVKPPAWLGHLSGAQKLLGVVAFILALLILLNPEFTALGIMGDTAFFDTLVLALSLQMRALFARAFQCFASVVARGVRCLGVPSPGARYMLAVSTLAITGAIAALQRAAHRISS